MLNLVTLARARRLSGRTIATGAEAYAAYGRESGPVFTRLGGKVAWQGRFELMLIGPRKNTGIIASSPNIQASPPSSR